MKLRSFTLSLTLCLLPSAFCPVQALPPEQAFQQFEQQLENSDQFSDFSSQLNSKLKTQNSELRTFLPPTLPLSFTPSPPLTFPPSPTPYSPLPTPSPQYITPTKGTLTSGYGWRWGRMHKGIDIAAPIGTPIVAAASGTVQFAAWNSGGYGYLVEILHSDGSLTRYGHNSRLLVQRGDLVEQGQAIAEMGSTGYSTGPHCHFEIHPAGKGAVNPLAYLGKRGANESLE